MCYLALCSELSFRYDEQVRDCLFTGQIISPHWNPDSALNAQIHRHFD